MLCKIADLLVEVPATGGMAPRCKEYLCEEVRKPDIIITSEKYSPKRYSDKLDEQGVAYLESGYQFCIELLKFDGLYIHASAVELNGQVYLFSGNSGIGKSTHTRLWQQVHGEAACIINDDKPALRKLDNCWYVYGTPWCGKDGINQNRKAELAGICFLSRGEKNCIRKLEKQEAFAKIVAQTVRKFNRLENLDLMIHHVNNLVNDIPIYELVCKPDRDAAILSYETMCRIQG